MAEGKATDTIFVPSGALGGFTATGMVALDTTPPRITFEPLERLRSLAERAQRGANAGGDATRAKELAAIADCIDALFQAVLRR